MTRDEFLYEHDVIGISAMIAQLNKGKQPTNNETPDEMLATDFL